MNRRPWTQAEDLALLLHLGEPLPLLLAALPGRTSASCAGRAARIHGVTSLAPGSEALNTMVRRTGYAPEQLLRARDVLGQQWRKGEAGRAPRGGRATWWRITEEQAQALLDYLANEAHPWARRYSHCVGCGTTDLPHKGRGLCLPCWRADPVERTKQLARQARWRARQRTGERRAA